MTDEEPPDLAAVGLAGLPSRLHTLGSSLLAPHAHPAAVVQALLPGGTPVYGWTVDEARYVVWVFRGRWAAALVPPVSGDPEMAARDQSWLLLHSLTGHVAAVSLPDLVMAVCTAMSGVIPPRAMGAFLRLIPDEKARTSLGTLLGLAHPQTVPDPGMEPVLVFRQAADCLVYF